MDEDVSSRFEACSLDDSASEWLLELICSEAEFSLSELLLKLFSTFLRELLIDLATRKVKIKATINILTPIVMLVMTIRVTGAKTSAVTASTATVQPLILTLLKLTILSVPL